MRLLDKMITSLLHRAGCWFCHREFRNFWLFRLAPGISFRSFVRFDGLWGFLIWDSSFWGRPKNVRRAGLGSVTKIRARPLDKMIMSFLTGATRHFARNIFDLLDFWHSIILTPIKIVPLNSLFLESVSKISESLRGHQKILTNIHQASRL